MFAAAVEPLLATLSDTDAAHERARLFGSAISPGVAETVLSLEASRRPEPVAERWLEYRLEGDFTLGDETAGGGACAAWPTGLTCCRAGGCASSTTSPGSAPQAKLALQAPIYALCAQERLASRDGAAWSVDEAAYVSLRGPAHAGAGRQGRVEGRASGWPTRGDACWTWWPTSAPASFRRARWTR